MAVRAVKMWGFISGLVRTSNCPAFGQSKLKNAENFVLSRKQYFRKRPCESGNIWAYFKGQTSLSQLKAAISVCLWKTKYIISPCAPCMVLKNWLYEPRTTAHWLCSTPIAYLIMLVSSESKVSTLLKCAVECWAWSTPRSKGPYGKTVPNDSVMCWECLPSDCRFALSS